MITANMARVLTQKAHMDQPITHIKEAAAHIKKMADMGFCNTSFFVKSKSVSKIEAALKSKGFSCYSDPDNSGGIPLIEVEW